MTIFNTIYHELKKHRFVPGHRDGTRDVKKIDSQKIFDVLFYYQIIKKGDIMMIGECWHQCTCSCHDETNKLKMTHFAPCCEGKCEICGRFIKQGLMARHKKECHGITEKE